MKLYIINVTDTDENNTTLHKVIATNLYSALIKVYRETGDDVFATLIPYQPGKTDEQQAEYIDDFGGPFAKNFGYTTVDLVDLLHSYENYGPAGSNPTSDVMREFVSAYTAEGGVWVA